MRTGAGANGSAPSIPVQDENILSRHLVPPRCSRSPETMVPRTVEFPDHLTLGEGTTEARRLEMGLASWERVYTLLTIGQGHLAGKM